MSAEWPIAGSLSEYASRLRAHYRLSLLVESDSGFSLDGHGVPEGGGSHEGHWKAGERLVSIGQTVNVRCLTYLEFSRDGTDNHQLHSY